MKAHMKYNKLASSTMAIVLTTLVMTVCTVRPSAAQSFSSGSDGSDGAFVASGPPGTVIVFDPTQFHGTQTSANIFNFVSISIAAGVTVRLPGETISTPVIWLSQENVDILGTIELSGSNGHSFTPSTFLRAPALPGPGGYVGGVGGNASQPPLAGSGPAGGFAATATTNNTPSGLAGGGGFSGNSFLIPLVGGSGGGGGKDTRTGTSLFGGGGGAGGGALLIASSTQIVVNGAIRARGGNGGASGDFGPPLLGAGGGGGAIRLVANTIAGTGTLDVSGGSGASQSFSGGLNFAGFGVPGYVRLEATTVAFSGPELGRFAQRSIPFPLLLPTAGVPTARVVSVAGIPLNANPITFPDVTINSTTPVDVLIETRNVPPTATVILTILNQNGTADTAIPAPPLGNCVANVCTTTVPVAFPFGASRGLTRVTWVQ